MNQLLYLPVLLYPIRVLLISVVLFGYYRVLLRDAPFHTFNRWYLLLAAPATLLLPLLRFPLPWISVSAERTALVQVVFRQGYGDTAAGPGVATGTPVLVSTLPLFLAGVYGIVALILLFNAGRSVCRVMQLTRNYPSTRIGAIRFYEVDDAAAPFSFFNRLCWPRGWDAHQDPGRLIFLHETYHIRQRHTLDLLALDILRSLGWFNPFLHGTLKEMRTLHEFAADRYAIAAAKAGDAKTDRGRYDYAELLVWQSVSHHTPFLTHSFFHQPLNRRITMITHIEKKRKGPLTRIMVLPLLLFVLAAFASVPARNHTPAGNRVDSVDKKILARCYTKHLRYPDQALREGREGTAWFSLRIGKGGKLQEYRALEAAPVGKELIKISVSAYRMHAAEAPPAGTDVFGDECRKVAGLIGTDAKTSTLTPGEYYMQIVFQLENK